MIHRSHFTIGGWAFASVVAIGVAVAPVQAQQHTTGLQITKTCPGVANEGDTINCTVTVENQDPDHGVLNLVVSNEYPFPGGTAVELEGCAAVLAPNDGTQGVGADFTTCLAEETFDQPCTGTTIVVQDRAVATGEDADPVLIASGGFGGLPVTGSTTNAVLVRCSTPTPTSTPTDTPTATPTDTPEDTPTATPTDTPTPTNTPTNTPTGTSTPTNTPTPTATDTVTATATPEEGEGCTPGFWKQPHHFEFWVGYDPSDSFDDVFGVDAPGDLTLLEALQLGGGGYKALVRHAVAALLNASNPDVDSGFTEAEVIALVQEAFDTEDFDEIKNILAAANEQGCPIGQRESDRLERGQRKGRKG